MKKQAIKISVAIIGLSALLAGAAMADPTTGYASGDFKTWAGENLQFLFEQITFVVSLIAIPLGAIFTFLGLSQLRKHHTAQGAQGENLKQGFGQIAIGVALFSLMAIAQMIQASLFNSAGDESAQVMVNVQTDALDNS